MISGVLTYRKCNSVKKVAAEIVEENLNGLLYKALHHLFAFFTIEHISAYGKEERHRDFTIGDKYVSGGSVKRNMDCNYQECHYYSHDVNRMNSSGRFFKVWHSVLGLAVNKADDVLIKSAYYRGKTY